MNLKCQRNTMWYINTVTTKHKPDDTRTQNPEKLGHFNLFWQRILCNFLTVYKTINCIQKNKAPNHFTRTDK
jgi:hypothetical protein